MKKIIFILLSIISVTANAQISDTVNQYSTNIFAFPDAIPHSKSSIYSFIPPAAFITYGALSFKVKGIRQVDYNVYNDLIKDHPNFNNHIENYLQYAPVVMVYGLNIAGVQGKNSFIDRTILLGMSEGIMGLTVFSLKHATNRLRPDGSDRFSFPSGHTGNAFAAAEFMAQEYSEKSIWYGVAGYSFATATAILRVYNRDHWFSDVIAGAGFGIISTKAAYLIYPLFRNKLFHKNNSVRNSLIMPTYSNGVAGFAFVKQL
ncbi:phosphatase PAP2 family protein [Mucilaginibacter segetis]|uniref:Phosphatase PAP2 family protein n=1 Tax=Mucilaginibacter segetis TaxID=2793071 RepID=A0A934PQI5_9SPHI|nr:phosphatase PAP2 family protein [Mucilaginibacter segetis]MBK0378904.1 phosphatase PAP2 family protein [Mucilaginibacter segetis]